VLNTYFNRLLEGPLSLYELKVDPRDISDETVGSGHRSSEHDHPAVHAHTTEQGEQRSNTAGR
jgi:hypothetical protein